MTDTVRPQAELLALGTEGIPDSFTYQDYRDLVVSVVIDVIDVIPDNGAVIIADDSTPMNLLTISVPAGRAVYWVARLYLFGNSIGPRYSLANGLDSTWNIRGSNEMADEQGTLDGSARTTIRSLEIIEGWSRNAGVNDEIVQLVGVLQPAETSDVTVHELSWVSVRDIAEAPQT